MAVTTLDFDGIAAELFEALTAEERDALAVERGWLPDGYEPDWFGRFLMVGGAIWLIPTE